VLSPISIPHLGFPLVGVITDQHRSSWLKFYGTENTYQNMAMVFGSLRREIPGFAENHPNDPGILVFSPLVFCSEDGEV